MTSSDPDHTTRRLSPNAGYEKKPLVSLRQACQSLEGILSNELDKFIKQALDSCQIPKYGLKQDESVALFLYTID